MHGKFIVKYTLSPVNQYGNVNYLSEIVFKVETSSFS